MNYILFPGRHHLITRFQIDYLKTLLQEHQDAEIIWAVTSADHTGTQRNPISGARRLGMIEAVTAVEQFPSEVYLIPNRRQRPDFAHYLIEEIRTQSNGRIAMQPTNTIVACSTDAVIAQYQALGFEIATVEQQSQAALPWDVVQEIIAAGAQWAENKEITQLMHPVCQRLYRQYHLAGLVQTIYTDPLVGSDDGDITATRDYASYRAAFEDNAWRKVNDFAEFVQPGKIVDVGCATGQTIKLLGERPELFESDFYGVEVARPLYEICQQRKTNGEFGDTNVYFYQRNIMQSELFDPGSMSTVITMALTHEVESYLGHEELLKFVSRAYEMLAPGGVYINYDVVGPEDREREVYFLPRRDDGENPEDLGWALEGEELSSFLGKLSTAARLTRFVHDFREHEGDGIVLRYESIGDHEYAVLTHGDLCEFLAKKDYLDSWKSEMHERFCFYTHDEWCEVLTQAGFEIVSGSRAITNPWLIDHRFAPAGQVYDMIDDVLIKRSEPPVTNTLLVARKLI
jgi:SAM-dependent methyltransferase